MVMVGVTSVLFSIADFQTDPTRTDGGGPYPSAGDAACLPAVHQAEKDN